MASAKMASNDEAVLWHFVCVDTTLTRRYCNRRNSFVRGRARELSQQIMLWLLNKTQKLLAICHEVLQLCALFLKRGRNIHSTVAITGLQFFVWLLVALISVALISVVLHNHEIWTPTKISTPAVFHFLPKHYQLRLLVSNAKTDKHICCLWVTASNQLTDKQLVLSKETYQGSGLKQLVPSNIGTIKADHIRPWFGKNWAIDPDKQVAS